MDHPFIDNALSYLSTPAPQWTAKQDASILEPYTYVASSPGKGVRSQLIEAFDHWFQVPSSQLKMISRTIELLHNASLLVDDIEDNSELRRGKPGAIYYNNVEDGQQLFAVAHKVYGVPLTINAANYAYFLAYQEILNIPDVGRAEKRDIHHNSFVSGHRGVQILNDEILASHRGQGRELISREYLQCPTEEEYIQIVRDKTGAQFRLLSKLMMEYSTVETDVDCLPLAELLGVWFQIRDDYANLQYDSYTEKKGFAEDLEEGKFSFPIVHGVGEKSDSKYLLNILHQKPKDPMLKKHTVAYLKDVTHSLEYTLSAIRSLEAQARAELTRLGGNPKLEALFDRLAGRECIFGEGG